MSDDRKDEEAAKPLESVAAVAGVGRLEAAKPLESVAAVAGVGRLAVDVTVIGKTVRYVDFGFTSAREYWVEVAEPAYDKFIKDESRGNAIMAFLALSPLPDWLWHEQHPGEDTRNNKDYEIFRQQLFANCPELAWLRDVADAGKHRGLGRANLQVREAAKTWPRNTQPLTIVLDNGTEHNITDVLVRVVEYFRKTHFPK